MHWWEVSAQSAVVCFAAHNSRDLIFYVITRCGMYYSNTFVTWTISATDVLVHMLMKGAAKCNNHCELQNSVNQSTIERRSALGAFLRACLCQCFLHFSGIASLWEHDDCASSPKRLLRQASLPQCVELATCIVVHAIEWWTTWTWHQAKQPAEFKHISKWRMWNQMGILK